MERHGVLAPKRQAPVVSVDADVGLPTKQLSAIVQSAGIRRKTALQDKDGPGAAAQIFRAPKAKNETARFL
jgi:hypothetical protein